MAKKKIPWGWPGHVKQLMRQEKAKRKPRDSKGRFKKK